MENLVPMNREVILSSSLDRLFVFLLLTCANYVHGQASYPTGTLLDDARYDTHDSYNVRDSSPSVPKVYSMKGDLPKVGNQVNLPIDVGWAIAHATTLLYSRSKVIKRDIQFRSPYFVNMLLSERNDVCETGVSLSEAVEALKNVGIPSIYDYRYPCPSGIDGEILALAQSEEVHAFRKVFERDATEDEKVNRIKSKIALDQPVMLAMHTPRSFLHTKGFWQPKETEPEEWPLHTMVVVGYDDDQAGGAFEVVNSWGTDWGNASYIWLRYEDFQFVRYGYAVSYLRDAESNYSTLGGNLNFNNADTKEILNPVKGDYRGYYLFESSVDNLNFNITGGLDKPFYLKMYYKSNDDVSLIYPTESWRSSLFDFSYKDFEIPGDVNYYTLDDESTVSLYVFISFQNLDQMDFEAIVASSNTINELTANDKFQVSNLVLWDQSAMSFSGKMAEGHILPLLIELDLKQ